MAVLHSTKFTFTGGEQSRKVGGRSDTEINRAGVERMLNFRPLATGGAEYRPGFTHVKLSRQNKQPFFKPYLFSDTQSYVLEFTHEALRFYSNDGAVLEATKTITDITKDTQGVVTVTSHGYSNGNEVFLAISAGMVELGGRFVIVSDATTHTFKMKDYTGAYINTTSYSTFSAGTAARVYEITTPYDEADDLSLLSVAQDKDVMYIAHPGYLPRKLTRADHTSWTLALYPRTDDPFTEQKTVSNAVAIDPCLISASTHGFVANDKVIFENVGGATGLNSNRYLVLSATTNNFTLADEDGDPFDGTGIGSFTSGGYATKHELSPDTVTLYESRTWLGGMDEFPGKYLSSKSPSPTTGENQYDVFTAGTDPDSPVSHTINGEVNDIKWLSGSDSELVVGTFGAVHRVTGGGGSETAITAASPPRVRTFDRVGTEPVAPVSKEGTLFYVGQGGLTVKTMEYDFDRDKFISVDRTLLADHILESGVKQLCWVNGVPNMLLAVRNDGVMAGLVVHYGENAFPWFRLKTGSEDQFVTAAALPRSNALDRLWVAVKRVIGATTTYSIEYMNDHVVFPKRLDYYTGDEDADDDHFAVDLMAAQFRYNHLDASLSFDGRDLGTALGATITPSAVTGSITMSASTATFVSGDVGREIRSAITGAEAIGGRAVITEVSSATVVSADVIHDFEDTTTMPAGQWYLTTDTIRGLEHLNGRTVSIVTDGGQHPDAVVSGGVVSLEYQSGSVHAGLSYLGSVDLFPVYGETDFGVTKLKSITGLGFKFLESLGTAYGHDQYAPTDLPFPNIPLPIDQPVQPFSGSVQVPTSVASGEELRTYVRQNRPFPCILQLIEIFGELETEL